MPKDSTTSTNRRWVPKTPVQVVLDQISKQEKKVQGLKDELKKEEQELLKIQQAKKIFEGQS
jgi:hypothetical protein